MVRSRPSARYRILSAITMGTLILVLAACLAGPPLVVGLAAVGVPWQITTALVASVGIVVLWRTVVQARAIGYQRLYWPAVVAVLTVLGAATIYNARLSTFMLDETRVDLSVLPNRAFFRAHSCLSVVHGSGTPRAERRQHLRRRAVRGSGEPRPEHAALHRDLRSRSLPVPAVVSGPAAGCGRRGTGLPHDPPRVVRRSEHRALREHGAAGEVDRGIERPARAAARASDVVGADDAAHTANRQLPAHRVCPDGAGDDRF